jgi:mannose-6-phosphate isomerase-like protein (cupin superfamily)
MRDDKKGAALPEALAAGLAEGVAPIAPLPHRAAAVKARIVERVRRERARFLTVHAGDGSWVPVAPGVQSKVLHDDGTTRSFLLRLEPGARLPSHGHAAEEACLVLEGSAQLGDIEVRAGDFHLAPAGSVHGEVTSRTGALLFLRAASGTGLRA